MTPAARVQAAITILDQILSGDPAEAALLRWSRSSRFAGSGDRAAIRDLVFDSLRRRRSRAALGGALTGRGLILGMCLQEGLDPVQIFTGEGHAPAKLAGGELGKGRQPTEAEALDLPDWVQPLWAGSLGANAKPVARAMSARAPVWLRANALRATPAQAIASLAQDGIVAQSFTGLPTALVVIEGARKVSNARAYRDGLVELQDLSPQLACAMLPTAQKVLDYCAGGGGKSLAIAARGNVDVTAHDANPARMNDLPSRADRAGAKVRIAKSGQIRGTFDLVVTDVPCSGSGTWRRTPDAKWRLDRDRLRDLVEIQAGILDDAGRYVAPNGYLAYMTCSLIDEENGQQVAAFAGRSEFELHSQRVFTPLDASDGFFVAILRRR
ncbi:RsmB/NOP family class I SAM-dependent RNA methyltransferase [Paracoccus aestuariivivens]|uniref:RsmB/NOP family class I SAM-dependent RNA methyltransferase n=1 Tax=Paracoccus aestuariivivens TaxID=1820333 RepID=A0A6L6J731_9RHOB|nr:RsmB/NOP family class I SAM-dependent RNA methyltransferase [Paracoccus aestuariivivens]MTH76437.1 RsmB/NOP family class I SAM-dependent RNA methyltransferase [Paracoccus aestuariivivens]